MITPRNVYRRFVEFEERAAVMYLQLASRFSQDPKLSSFWLDMALHEKQHAGLLQFCLQDGLLASDLPGRAEIQQVTDLFEKLEARAAAPGLTIEDAFKLALELESSEVNSIYCYLTATLHSSMYLLRRKIATSMPDHLDELLVMARKFGVKNSVMQEFKKLRDDCSSHFQDRK